MNRQILQDCIAGKLDGPSYESPELIQAITSAKFLVEVKGREDSRAIKTAAGIILAEMDGG